ncbi:glycosyl hydrolase [Tritrichomonas foetus]|uniref:alpha-mannosidase n=1 Tax=Tritrichomonas foetus TaxID=1144522 RepID=A0A1J4JV50_9EUKA|nr:glycosyl hydrolase [Tritrichomonas foetus]|eukprot:OHT03039.1 glycosyl hydrolase [Tritrichomonas foetus]
MLFFTFLSFIAPILVVDPRHTIQKFNKILNSIEPLRTITFRAVKDGKICREASASHKLPSEEASYKWESVDFSKGWQFDQDRYRWFAFRGTMQIPEEYNPEKHWLKMHFGITRHFLTSTDYDNTPDGPEGRYWINGKVVAAIDGNHDGFYLNGDESKNGNDIQVRIFAGRIMTQHYLDHFGVDLIHKETDTYYRRVKFLVDVLNQLSNDNPDKHQIVKLIDESTRFLDLRELKHSMDLHSKRIQDPTHAAFYESVGAALKHLKEGLEAMPRPYEDDPAISLLGYSHIDTMWLWPFDITHFKTTNTAATMLHLLDNPPNEFENPVQWKFLATAPQHYKWMEEDSKDIFDRVREMAQKGRWDVNGVMWLEPDTTLPSGESLARSIVYGVKYFKNHVPEYNSTVLFLPDCFGYSAALPQILRAGECDSFVTSKISWNEYTEFPYSSFQWRGIDGSIVNSHFISTPTGGQANTYNGVSNAFELIGTWGKEKENKIIRSSALHTSGHGDGGGGITEEMVWNYNMFNELPKIEGVPRLKFRTLDQVMDELRQKQHLLPVWDDELYLEYHRGTLTSFEEMKRQNRQLESHLHNVEWLMTIAYTLFGDSFNYRSYQEEIMPAWEDTLLMHFHDCIPGSSINEANNDAIRRGRPFLKQLRDIEKEIGEIIAKKINVTDGEEIIFNTLSHDRYITKQRIPSGGWGIKKDGTVLYTDEQTTEIYERKVKEDIDVVNTLYEPFYQTVYPPVEDSDVVIKEEEGKIIVTTPLLMITFDEKGHISSVIDQKTDVEYIEGAANIFELYEDRSMSYPAWELTLYHKEMQLEEPIFDGYIVNTSCIISKWHIPRIGTTGKCNETTIEQVITFSPNSPEIDFKTVIEWTQHDKILKVAFPTSIRSRDGRFGIQFGNLKRPTHNNTEADKARFEASGRWVDLGEEERGVALIADTKNGYDVHDNIIRLSLLKASMQSDRWEDFGKRKFAYRAIFHNNAFSESDVVQSHDELNVPPCLAQKKSDSDDLNEDTFEEEQAFVTVSDKNVILDTLKIAEEEDAFIARFYESSGSHKVVIVTFPILKSTEWCDAEMVSLLEVPFKNGEQIIYTKLEGDNLSFRIVLKPFQILTLRIKRNK